eukprot:19833-Heterococcus_DN1.PRE.1
MSQRATQSMEKTSRVELSTVVKGPQVGGVLGSRKSVIRSSAASLPHFTSPEKSKGSKSLRLCLHYPSVGHEIVSFEE